MGLALAGASVYKEPTTSTRDNNVRAQAACLRSDHVFAATGRPRRLLWRSSGIVSRPRLRGAQIAAACPSHDLGHVQSRQARQGGRSTHCAEREGSVLEIWAMTDARNTCQVAVHVSMACPGGSYITHGSTDMSVANASRVW